MSARDTKFFDVAMSNVEHKIAKHIEEKYEPIEKLQEINQLLNQHHVEFIEIFSHQENLANKKDFYTKVFKGVSTKMLNERLFSKPNYLPQILKFFKNILVNYFPYDVEEELMAEIVHSIFNLDASLYTNALQSQNVVRGLSGVQSQDAQNIDPIDEEVRLETKRIESEREWRNNLKVGDNVDVVKVRQIQLYRIASWSRGQVSAISEYNENMLTISFEGENDMTVNLSRFAPEIAHPLTFTDDFDWRYSLQPNTEVDGCDTEGVWYKSTVFSERVLKVSEEKQIKEVYVGFRVYRDEGSKYDDETNKRYIGWSNKYDEYKNVTCQTIQRFGTVSKAYKQAGKDKMNYDNIVDDNNDVIHNTKDLKIWAVFRSNHLANLRCIPDYLNEFGQRGGFEKIIKVLENSNPTRKTSLSHICYLMDFLSKIQPLWHRQFSCYYIPQIKKAFEKGILHKNAQQTGILQQKIVRDQLSNIQKHFNAILKRHYTQEMYSMIMGDLQLNIGFTLLESDKLETRIQGLKEILEQIKNSKFNTMRRQAMPAQDLVRRLKQSDIFEKVFGDNYHIALIQKSQELLKFLAAERELQQQEIDLIWACTKRDQQTKMEIYKIIQDLSINLKNEEIELFIDKFAQIPPEEFVEKEIECVYDLTKFSHRQNSFSIKAAQLFWDVATQVRPYRKQIVEIALDKFIEVIKNWDRELKGEYIIKCAENISETKASIQSIKIMQKILDQIPNHLYQSNASLYDTANGLIDKFKLFDMIIKDIAQYIKLSNEIWDKGVLHKDNLDNLELLNTPFSHRSQLFLRLNFIRAILSMSKRQLDQQILDSIWDLLLVNSKIPINGDIFFDWFKSMISDNNKLQPELMLHFFQYKVCSNQINFKNVKKAGFDCIQSLFLQINELEDKISLNSQYQYNAISGQNQNKIDFKVLVPPNELIGIDVIWNMLKDCDKKNLELNQVILEFLTKIYHNVSSSLESQIHQIEEEFIEKCLQKLEQVVYDEKVTGDEKQMMCRSTLEMIKSFIEDSEKNGTGGVKSHHAIDKGDFIQNIVIQNNITTQKQCPKFIVLNTYSNMTIWELKRIIALKTKQSPLKIQILRQDARKQVIGDQNNAKMLRELHIDSWELLTASKKPIISIPRISLTNKQKQLIPEAKKIFDAWFERFSDAEGWMTPETCAEFIRSSTSDSQVTSLDTRVKKLFDDYDTDKDEKISREEFLEFYREKSLTKAETVWGNLQAHHYTNDLKLNIYSPYNDDDQSELKNMELLPRYKLSSNDESFQKFFKMIDYLKAQGGNTNFGQDDLWQLLTQLRTNPNTFLQLLSHNGTLELRNTNISIYYKQYCLQIIQSFINEYSVNQQSNTINYYTELQEEYNQNYPSLNEQGNNDQSSDYQRDRQNQAPKSGAVIPMPPGGNSQIISGKIGGNIPEPPLQGPLIGPSLPPQNNNNNNVQEVKKVQEMIQNFQGFSVIENFNSYYFRPQEFEGQIPEGFDQNSYKFNWLPAFVNLDGFSLFLELMTNVYEENKSKKPDDLFKSKIEKEYLGTLMKIMKIIVMSSFSANNPNNDIMAQLERKMSRQGSQFDESNPSTKQQQPKDEFSKEDQKEEEEGQQQQQQQDVPKKEEISSKKNVQQEQNDIAKQYEPLIQILQGELGLQILANLDFEAFQQSILGIIQLILRKNSIFLDDRGIIDQGLSLWISCLLYNPDLLQTVYDQQELNAGTNLDDIEIGMVNQNKVQSKQSACYILIEEGLIAENWGTRCSFKEALLFICQVIKSPGLTELPLFFFLKMLLQKIDKLENKWRESKQYFQLIKELLTIYFDIQKKQPFAFKKIFDSKELLVHLIKKLQYYQSKEQKNNFKEDTNLIGYMMIISELISNNPQALTENQYQQLMTEIVEKCLFTFDQKPLENHITKDIDIQKSEKPYINKCQTFESREQAFNLLMTICKVEPNLIGEIIQNYWHPLLFKVKKPKNKAPRTECRSSYGWCGIRNLGCICYMNSMIQQFFHIPTFRYSLMATDDKQPPNPQLFEDEMVDDNILHQLMKFMSFLELSERQDYNPKDFCFSFKDFDGRPTNVRIQQDAQEFLNVAFDRLENMLKGTTQQYLLQNVFGGKTCSLMICKSCGNLKERQEDFYNLSLEVRNQNSIYEGLQKYTLGEVINDFQCEACGKRVDVEKKTVIQKLPNVLIVHLQRIYFDFDSLSNQKLNSRVEFPNVLNMKQYMYNEVIKQEKELLKKIKREQKKAEKKESQERTQNQKKEDSKVDDSESSPEKKEQINTNSELRQEEDQFSSEGDSEMEDVQEIDSDENYEYKLVGVVVHMGTADAGHYISFINIERNKKPEDSPDWLKTESEKWLEFNDSQVRSYNFKNLEEDCFGGSSNSFSTTNDYKNDYSRNAYMLIYEKRRKEQIKIVIPQELLQSSSSLDCDSTAISRGVTQDLITSQENINSISKEHDIQHIIYTCPNIQERLYTKQGIEYDEEKKEYYTLVNFNNVEKFVPNSLYKLVQEDNLVFLSEKHVFNNSFFKCTHQMLELLNNHVPEILAITEESSRLFQFMEKLVFDIVANTSENKQLGDLTKLFINMLSKNNDQTKELVLNRILRVKQEKKAGDASSSVNKDNDDKNFFEILISTMDRDVRDMAQNTLTYLVNKLFEIDDYETINQIMDIAFSMLPEEASKNWLKIHQFLTFLYEVTKSGAKQMQYMVEKKLITKLIDFFLENESPLAQGQRRNQMGSNYANPPFEILVLNISFIARNMPYIPIIPPELIEGLLPAQNYYNYPYDESKFTSFFLRSFDNFCVKLASEDIKMLQLKQFYIKAMKCGYHSIELGRLASHVGFENQDFSNRISKKLVLGVNKSTGDDIQPYLDVIEPFLLIEDYIKPMRYEWILGIPYLKFERPATYQMASNENNLKVGVTLIDSISDDIYEYRSTLFKLSSTVKESLLQIFYQYRNRWPKQSLLIAQTLLKVANYEFAQGYMYKYLKFLEPPTYQFARYIDWIKPYLKDQIESSVRSNHIQSYKQELEIAVNALSIYEQLEQKYEENKDQQLFKNQDQPVQQQDQDKQQQQQNNEIVIDHQDLEFGGPQAYLIWSILEEKLIERKDFIDENVQIILKEYKVMCSQSAPTGTKNLAIPQNTFQSQSYGGGYNNNNRSNQGNRSNMATVHRKPKFGRGQNLGSQKKTGRQSRQDGKKKSKGKKTITTGNGTQQEIEEYEEDNPQSQDYEDSNGEANQEIYYSDNGASNVPALQQYTAPMNEGPEKMQVDDQTSQNAEKDEGEENQSDQDLRDVNVEGISGWQPGATNLQDLDQPAVYNEYQNPDQDPYNKGLDGLSQIPYNMTKEEEEEIRRAGGNPTSAVPNIVNPSSQSQINQQDVRQQDFYGPHVPSNTSQQNQSQYEAPSQQPQYEQSDEKQIPVILDNYWSEGLWTILVFSAINNDSIKSQKVILEFKPVESQDALPLNLRLPTAPIPLQIQSNREKEIAIFTKLRPLEESWGSFSFSARIERPKAPSYQVNQNNNYNNYNNYSQSNYNNNNIATANQSRVGPEQTLFPKDEPMPPATINTGIKQCPWCACQNDFDRTNCELCNTPL